MSTVPTALSLVGRTITVTRYQGKDLIPTLTGTIAEDTRSTLVVSATDGNRTFLKVALRCRIEGIMDDGLIDGKDLIGKIHDRIKQHRNR